MTTLRQVAEALAERLATIPGLRTAAFVPSDIQPPAAYVVAPETIDLVDLANTREDALPFSIVVLVAALGGVERKQLDLLDYRDVAGPKSIHAAIMSDPSLGFSDVNALVTGNRLLGVEELASFQHYGAVVDVSVRLG